MTKNTLRAVILFGLFVGCYSIAFAAAPTDIQLDGGNSDTVDEGTASGTNISILTTTDADGGDTHTYTLVGGTGDEDNGKFQISGTNLQLAFTPDYDNPTDLGDIVGNNTYAIRLQTDDGNSGVYQEAFIITVLEDSPPLPAGYVAGVGIDWESSTMMVEFEKENILVRNSTCFGATTPDTSCMPTGSYTYCVTEDLDTLGYSDTNSSPAIEDCFHEAGNYQVTIELEDFAGNTTVPSVLTFTVKAGSPDPDESELDVSGCPTDDVNAPIANNDGSCTLNLIVKDKYENPVSQLNGETINMYLDTLLSMDANNPNEDGSISFREGLLLAGTVVGTQASPTTFLLGVDYSGLGIFKTLNFTALAPTLEKVGNFLSKNTAFPLDFVFELPSINVSGAVDTVNLITFRYNQYSPNIKFRPMITSGVEIPGNKEFIIDVLKPMDIVRDISNNTGLATVANIMIGVTHHYLPWELKFDPTFFINDGQSAVSPFNTTTPPVSETVTKSATVVVRDSTVNYTENLSFSSVISYNIDNGGTTYSVSYPGGSIGAGFGSDCGEDPECEEADVTIKLIGASIEGSVLGETDTTKFGTDDNAILVGSNKFTDIREDIFKNAYKIARSLTPKTPSDAVTPLIFDPNWYDTTDVVVVEGDVEVTNDNASLVDFNIPSGKNTLIIKNGNLIFTDNLIYNDKQDSFGIILINDEVFPFPEKGNIFIKNYVKRISGTFFLEGGLMTNNDVTGGGTAVDIYGSSNGETTNDTQLLLEGVVLSHNTLGGGYEALYANGATDYLTPWGLVNTLATENESGYEAWRSKLTEATTSAEDLMIAKAYDLHMVRYYHPLYDLTPEQTNGDMCVCKSSETCDNTPGTGATYCDDNDNAFIIRTDGRMKQLPPPGFETVSTIKWE